MKQKIRQWFSLMREKNARGIILLFIILFNVILWLISSVIAYLIAPEHYGNIITALWASGITWMLEPGFYDPAVPIAIRIISILVILTSMITFTGGIIGYVANTFSNIIDNANKGKTKLHLYHHIVILNWNHKALELIADYRYDDETTAIVILSHHDKEVIENEIKRKLFDVQDGNKKKLSIIVRHGEVFSKRDLMNICIEDSKTVVILSDEHELSTLTHKDMLSMKTLMLVSNMNIKPHQTILVEVKEHSSIGLINDYIAKHSRLNDQILPLLPDELMGRLIAQTLLMPELNQVYHELLSFEGAEFYTVKDIKPREFMEHHHYAIPIYSLGDTLYVLSSESKDVERKREKPLHHYEPLTINDQTRYHEKYIVIFGKNQKLPYILDSIRLYERENHVKIHVSQMESNEASAIQSYTETIEHIDHILILSEDNLDPSEYDSEVLVTLLMTQELAKKHQAEIIIELLDPKHFDIAQSYNVQNTIISNEYLSRLMTQLSKNRKLYPLFIDLLTYDEEGSEEETYEVYAYKAQDILKHSFPISFPTKAQGIYTVFMSGNQDYVWIGTIKEGKLDIFKGNLDLDEPLIIFEEDLLVMICK
ncbi:MAG: hypothetical protein C4537_06590 [Acholeplasma sp.]|jgi:hypothetical protein|nr:MAG: hypothetical protein C4537_06590 [Acholeplasma sp.]